jgi:collagen triple helix repeat protein
MSVLSNKRLLVIAIGAFAVLGPAGLTASAAPSRESGNEASSRSSLGAHSVRGPRGPRGFRGRIGKRGLQGNQGNRGNAGLAGVAGAVGPGGAVGSVGPAGPEGPQGLPGTSPTPEYAYLYNAAVQTVPVESNVTLDTNGVMTSGITHTAGAAGITLVNIGVYRVTFSVSGTETSQFALFNGATMVPGSLYGSGAGTQQNAGQAIVVTTVANAVLTLRNHTSAAAVGLPTTGGGTLANTNASVLIQKLD